ncbi:hypothetical protein ACPXAU_24160, partial [Salmonella enterica]|uniref:hypothetical protein n=1 Tax=Salmonella enterica TaxID=28901 RepID=UPI003CEB1EC3
AVVSELPPDAVGFNRLPILVRGRSVRRDLSPSPGSHLAMRSNLSLWGEVVGILGWRRTNQIASGFRFQVRRNGAA